MESFYSSEVRVTQNALVDLIYSLQGGDPLLSASLFSPGQEAPSFTPFTIERLGDVK